MPRVELWKIFQEQLETKMDDLKLDPGLRRTLWHLLLPMIPDSEPKELSPTYQQIYNNQVRMGQRSIFLGYFVHNWVTTQQTYLEINQLPNDKQQAKTAIATIGVLLLKQAQSIWHVRNKQLHGSDIDRQLQHKLELL